MRGKAAKEEAWKEVLRILLKTTLFATPFGTSQEAQVSIPHTQTINVIHFIH